MKKIAIIISAICILCGSYSCSDMLETDSSRQVFDPQLNQKTDSIFYALGILQGVQQLADPYVFLGEMRGDLTKTTTYTDNNLRQLADFTATTANKYDSAYVYYRIINNCNYYIAHRDTTLRNGAEYVAMKEYAAVKAIRAWTYMQMARVYGKVPFYTEPLTSISQINNGNYPEMDMKGIVNALAPDLEQYTGYSVPDYGSTPAQSNFVTTKIFIPVDVILGDMYLETQQYEKAANHYITYLTEVATEDARSTAYWAPYATRRGNSLVISLNTLPSDWDVQANLGPDDTETWSSIFTTTSSDDIISYIPLPPSSRQGITTEIPKAFGYDYYSTTNTGNARYIDEIQIYPSDNYVELSNKQSYYYYSTSSTPSVKVINEASIGDTRYNNITRVNTDEESDSTTVWVTKYTTARVILYRNTTVLLHLAEAFNRLGLYDAAFAILKDGINRYLPYTLYMRPSTLEALQTTYPLLSSENISKFSSNGSFYGVHSHGAGFSTDYYSPTMYIGSSPYQLQPIVGKKMAEIANEHSVVVGTTLADTINAMEDLLCDEYALEFAFEGSRFYDLCRLARHKNEDKREPYGANFGGRWLAKKLAYKKPAVALDDEKNWYLPFK